MAYTVNEPRIGVQPISTLSTTQKHPIGTIVQANDPTYGDGLFMYVKGLASVEDNDWLVVDVHNSGTVARADAGDIGTVGIAVNALTSSYYGWMGVKGVFTGKCLTQCADNANIYLTSTDATVDDASVAGDLISGAVARSTTVADSGVALFEIDRPFVTDADS